MATITCDTSRHLVYIDLNVTERSGSGSSATNKSTIDYSVVIRKGSVGWNTSWDGWGQRIYATYYIEGLGTKTVYIPTYNYGGNVPPGSTIASGSFEIEHSNDGTKTISFNISFTDNANGNNSGSYYTPGNGSQVSGSLTLATIPRYTSVSTWSVASKTETSITLNWKTADTVKSIRYGTSTSSYSTATVDGTSGQVTITGLSANTGYTLYFMPCRKDSSLWGDGSDGTWKSLSGQSTYDWPKITGTPDFTIGTNFTVSLYNPLGRSCSIYLKGDNNSQGSVKTTTGTSVTDFNNSSWKTFWYNSIPNKTGLDSNNKAQYKVRLVCSAVSRDTTVNGGYYRIKNDGTEIPNFSDSNWSYSGNLTSLTGSNQSIIKQYSTITFTVGTAATSSYGATIVKYVYKWGTQSKDSTSGNTVTGGLTNVLEVDAVDSRGLIKATTKTLVSGTNYVPYNTPTLDYSNSFTHRTDGISTETKLTLRGNLSVMKFGSSGVNNALNSVKYKVYDYTAGTWSSQFTIPISSFTLQASGYFSLNNYTIHANGSSGGFTTGKRYAIQIILKDAAGSLATLTSNNILVTDGKIARDVYQDSNGDYHQGINGMADSNYTEKIYGTLNTTEDVNASRFLKENGYQITEIDISETSETLLNRVKDLASHNILQATWVCLWDGASANISDKPTGSTNAGFVCYANCNRRAASNDWRYVLTAYVQQTTDYYISIVTNSTTSLTWTRPINGKAPTSHASSATTYGVGTTSNYGHCRVINNLTTSSATNGYALQAYQGKVLKELIDSLTTELNKLKETVLWTGSTKINGDNNTTKTLSSMPDLTNYSGKHLKLQFRYTGDMAVVQEFVIGSFSNPLFFALTRDYSGTNDQWTLLFSITSMNSTNWKIKTNLSWQIQNTSLTKINSNSLYWYLEKVSVIGA